MADPREEGRRAYHEKPWRRSPYGYLTSAHLQWRKGFGEEAKQAEKRRIEEYVSSYDPGGVIAIPPEPGPLRRFLNWWRNG